jgi:protein dithiol:quinone oxidoreductase
LKHTPLNVPREDRLNFAALAALALGAVVIALISQHSFDMQPCPWCIVQRMIYVVVGAVGLVAALWPASSALPVQRASTLLIAVGATLGASSALWQQLFAAKSSSCNLTVADEIVSFSHLDSLLPEIFQPRANCAEASIQMLGLPYAMWSLMLFLLLAVAAIRLHLEQRHRIVFNDSGFGGVTA